MNTERTEHRQMQYSYTTVYMEHRKNGPKTNAIQLYMEHRKKKTTHN